MTDVSIDNFRYFLEDLEKKNEERIYYWYKFFKGSFAHEMTHQLRNELIEEENTGQEIASHAVEVLSTEGLNPILDFRLKDMTLNPKTSYAQDVIASLKVIEQKLSNLKDCTYKPKDFTSKELNKAILSISEDKREKILSDLAQEIIKASPIELLKLAAKINVIPIKNPEPANLIEKLEKAS